MRLKAVVAPLLLAGVLGVTQGPIPLPAAGAAGTVQGVTLGESATTLVGQMGEPYNTQVNGNRTGYLYLAWSGNALELVSLAQGNVVSVAFYPTDHPTESAINAPKPSLLGIALQDPASKLQTLPASEFVSTKQLGEEAGTMHVYHDSDFQYVFTEENGFITSISVYLPLKAEQALAPSPMPVLHDGSSIANAVVVMAPHEDVGVLFEYSYLSDQHCTNGGNWTTTQQALLHNGGRSYDQFDAVCSTDSSKRSFFFDITNFFGKL